MPVGVYERTLAHRKNISLANLGNKNGSGHRLDVAQREKIRARMLGNQIGKRSRSVATRERIRVAREGRHWNEATKQKMRESALRRLQRLDYRSSRPERLILSVLDSLGLSFIRQFQLPGNRHPFDFALLEQKLLIEVDGCYHHGCDCQASLRSWQLANRNRDRELDEFAGSLGWRVIRYKTNCEMTLDWGDPS